MRIFLVKDQDAIISVVAHDYRNGSFYCRSESESFRRAFDISCAKTTTGFVKESEQLRLHAYTPHDTGWMDTVLEGVCNGPWTNEELKVKHTVNFEDVVQQYLLD